MKLLVSSIDDVEEMLSNKSYRLSVWREMEERLSFLQALEDTEKPSREEKFKKMLTGGLDLLGALFRRFFLMLHDQAQAGLGELPSARQVPRRSAAELSVREFIEDYAKKGLPVIITGINITGGAPWTLKFFKDRCNVSVPLKRRNPKSDDWGRLQDAGRLPLGEFIDSFASNRTRRKWYLHDWSLPRNCPQVFGPAPFSGFTVPKYFVGDYFQRAAFEGYQHSWPSLFIGSSETQSSLHIDSGNTNFMLHLLSGRKEWRFYSAQDLVNLYASPVGAHFHYDVFRPDHKKFPLASYAKQFVGIQEPGETIFIPAGNPHAVRNLEPIHGISMNYVDVSNVKLSILERIWELEAPDVELYTDGISTPHGMVSDQEAMLFGEWKAQDWKRTKYDLF